MTITENLLTRSALAHCGCEEFVIRDGEHENRSPGELVIPKPPVKTMSDQQGPSGSKKSKERDDEAQEDRQSEEIMEQDADETENDEDKTSVGGASSLDFNFLDDDEKGTETLSGTTESADDETSTLEPPQPL